MPFFIAVVFHKMRIPGLPSEFKSVMVVFLVGILTYLNVSTVIFFRLLLHRGVADGVNEVESKPKRKINFVLIVLAPIMLTFFVFAAAYFQADKPGGFLLMSITGLLMLLFLIRHQRKTKLAEVNALDSAEFDALDSTD